MKFLQKIKKVIPFLKVLSLAYLDKRTPLWIKVGAGVCSVGYLLYFFDIIPDFIPVFGILDDAAIIPLIAWAFSRWIPRDVLIEAHQKIN